MRILSLELVKEKKTFPNHFTLPKIGGFTFLALVIPTFFILPFFKGADNWFFIYLYSVLSLSFICLILMNLKFNFKADYETIGNIILSENYIQIESSNKKYMLKCSDIEITFLYNSVRGKKFHFLRRDYARNGISEIECNNQKFYLLISNENQFLELKKILASWYQNNYSVSEFMRTPEQLRLKELELIE